MTVTLTSDSRNASANFPFISDGKWHVDGQGSGAQGPTIVANRAYAVPFWPGRRCRLTNLSMNIGVAFTTPGTIRAGVYATLSTGLPGALVTDFGTVAETAATKEWASLTTDLDPSLYCAVLVPQGGSTGTPTWSSCNIRHPLVFETNASAINPNTNKTAYYSDTGFTGALPATFGTPAGIIVGPSLAFKFSVL